MKRLRLRLFPKVVLCTFALITVTLLSVHVLASITKVTVGTNAVLLQAATNRQWAIIQNYGPGNLYVAVDGSTNVTVPSGSYPGILVPANGFITLSGAGVTLSDWSLDFWGVADQANTVVSVQSKP